MHGISSFWVTSRWYMASVLEKYLIPGGQPQHNTEFELFCLIRCRKASNVQNHTGRTETNTYYQAKLETLSLVETSWHFMAVIHLLRAHGVTACPAMHVRAFPQNLHPPEHRDSLEMSRMQWREPREMGSFLQRGTAGHCRKTQEVLSSVTCWRNRFWLPPTSCMVATQTFRDDPHFPPYYQDTLML